jgi:hypothetical protein
MPIGEYLTESNGDGKLIGDRDRFCFRGYWMLVSDRADHQKPSSLTEAGASMVGNPR